MRICVFGAASNEIDNKYIEEVEKMAEHFANKGHGLVFGAGGGGLMGAAARGFTRGGADIIGVIPHFFREAAVEPIYDKCTQLIFTDTMRERKARMEDEADAFVIVPGGIGTFEEFFEVLTLKQLGRHNKPIAIFNIDGYYDNMALLMAHSMGEKFVNQNVSHIYDYFTDAEALSDYLEKTTKQFSVNELKLG